MSYLPDRNFEHDVTLGRISGARSWSKWGFNPEINTGAAETVWAAGGMLVLMDTAATLSFVSTDAQDGIGGTGAREVTVIGVDENRERQEEVIVMDGTTPVVTTSLWFGVNRIYATDSGTNQANVGDISATGGGNVQAQVPAGAGTTQNAFFHCQLTHDTLIEYVHANAVKVSGGGGNPEITITAHVFDPATNSRIEVATMLLDVASESSITLNLKIPIKIPPGGVITFEAATDVNNTFVSLRFGLIEYLITN